MNNDNLEKFLDNAYRDIILGNYRSPKTDAKKVRAMVAGEIVEKTDKPVEKYTLSTGSMAVFGKPCSSTNVVSTSCSFKQQYEAALVETKQSIQKDADHLKKAVGRPKKVGK